MAESTITTGVKASGVTTIRWGTDGAIQNSYYVVLRVNERALAENIKLTNGSGVTSTRVIVLDGAQWDIAVRDDTRMTPPVTNDIVYVQDRAALFSGSTGLNYFPARVVDCASESSMKAAGERTFTVERLALIEGV